MTMTMNGTVKTGEAVSNWSSDAQCRYEPHDYILEKFYLVAVCGTAVAAISTVENSVLFYMLLSRPKFRTSHLFFTNFLAFFDILISICYIFLMSAQVKNGRRYSSTEQ